MTWLLVGACRDNEVSPSHPLMRTLDVIHRVGASAQEIVLAPFVVDDVGRLVADSLHIAGKRAKSSTAYASSLTYLVAGHALLAEDSWEQRYALTFTLEFWRELTPKHTRTVQRKFKVWDRARNVSCKKSWASPNEQTRISAQRSPCSSSRDPRSRSSQTIPLSPSNLILGTHQNVELYRTGQNGKRISCKEIFPAPTNA